MESMSHSLVWYWNRLRAMSPAELYMRGAHATRKWRWARCKEWTNPAPVVESRDPWSLHDPPALEPAVKEALCVEAERTLRGEYCMLNIEFNEPALDWHLDPQTGARAPTTYALDINYRDPALVGNVKNIWEKNRHHHVSVLAAAHAVTGDARYAEAVERQLTSWVQANPFLRGVNWTSALELGIRLIAWVWTERLLRGAPQHDALFGERGTMWPAIYRHQWLIRRYYAHGSSANNHLIGEMAGLFMASTIWPYYDESAEWETFSREKLELEVIRQTFDDGLNREQAFAYHLFSLDFFLLAMAEADRMERPFSTAYKEATAKMIRAASLLSDARGHLPRYGDGDEGKALDLGGARSALDCPTWEAHRIPAAPDETERDFYDAGLFLWVAARGTDRERFCLADAGPLGYLSLAAHGHADALSFVLNLGGRRILVDPGTGSYHADPAARAYYRSTRAHNTVTVDALDQSEPGGVFLWTRHARTRVLQWGGGRLVAEHDGYRRLADPVTHRRQLIWRDDRLTVIDELEAKGEHDYEFRLHFAPDCRLTEEADATIVEWDGGRLHVSRAPNLAYAVVCGGDEAGWYSPGFNVSVKAPTLIGAIQGTGPVRFEHEIRFE